MTFRNQMDDASWLAHSSTPVIYILLGTAIPLLLRVIPGSPYPSFEHVTLCMVRFLTFCIAPCFICFYRFLSRLEVHLCDISICVGEETFDNEANYYHIILSQDLVNDLK
jgi:hypothetical protein